MALFQSEWARGQKMAAVSREAGGVVAKVYEFTVTENLSTGDIIELACLPAYHTVVDAILDNDALGSDVTADVGIMSGDYGEDDDTRTSGDELFDGQAVATAGVNRMSEQDGFRIATSDKDRGIGLTIGGAGVTADDQTVRLILFTVQ